MALVRTNITIPEEVLALVDAVAGPRGRSAYISEVVAKQVRRDNALRVVRETAGALKGSKTWGETHGGVRPDPPGAPRQLGPGRQAVAAGEEDDAVPP